MSNDDVDGPIRTCVGCRVREPVSALIRIVAVSGVLIPDLRHRHPGRGSWVHPDQGCVVIADRRRAFARALRLSEPPDLSRIWALVKDVVDDNRE